MVAGGISADDSGGDGGCGGINVCDRNEQPQRLQRQPADLAAGTLLLFPPCQCSLSFDFPTVWLRGWRWLESSMFALLFAHPSGRRSTPLSDLNAQGGHVAHPPDS